VTRERPTRELIVRHVRWLMLVAVPFFSAVAGGLIIMQANPAAWQLPFAGATATGFFALVLVLLRLGSPKRRHFLGVLAVAAFLGVLTAPTAALIAGPAAMHVSDTAQLMGYVLFGAIVVAPLSSALGAAFGLIWFAALRRFSEALERPALTDVSSLTLRLGAGALGLAALSGTGVAMRLGERSFALAHERFLRPAFFAAEPLMVAGLSCLALGGLVLLAHGLWTKRRVTRILRDAAAGEHEVFCLAPGDLPEAPATELIAITRASVCTRVLCRRDAAKADGAYRLNRDHLTPWALMP